VILSFEFPLKTEETFAMTAKASIDPARLLEEQLAAASPDLLRQMLPTFIQILMSAEADAVCGASYGDAQPGQGQRP
jgi:putative transposase